MACKTADLSVAAKHQTSIKREVEVLKVVDHPNVCGILDTDAGDGEQTKVLLFMPLVLGGDLFSYMEKHNHLTEDEVRFAAKQLVEGVAYLHKKKIAHRGESPSSSVLKESREGYWDQGERSGGIDRQTSNRKTFSSALLPPTRTSSSPTLASPSLTRTSSTQSRRTSSL